MKENFSKGVQRSLKYAKEEAVRLGHSYVGSEHLLLGIIKDNKVFIYGHKYQSLLPFAAFFSNLSSNFLFPHFFLNSDIPKLSVAGL